MPEARRNFAVAPKHAPDLGPPLTTWHSLNAFGHRDGYMEYEKQVLSPWHGSSVISPIGGSELIVSAGQHSNSGMAMGMHTFKGEPDR
ncbi:MAG: hypothetical protein ACUVWR_12590 [Anaerolineae bacterium]